MYENAAKSHEVGANRQPADSYPAITRELDSLREQVGKLQAITRDLRDKIDPVLMPEGPCSDQCKDPSPALASPLAANLAFLNGEVREIQSALVNLINRIEL